jgi:hypothetical protein
VKQKKAFICLVFTQRADCQKSSWNMLRLSNNNTSRAKVLPPLIGKGKDLALLNRRQQTPGTSYPWGGGVRSEAMPLHTCDTNRPAVARDARQIGSAQQRKSPAGIAMRGRANAGRHDSEEAALIGGLGLTIFGSLDRHGQGRRIIFRTHRQSAALMPLAVR